MRALDRTSRLAPVPAGRHQLTAAGTANGFTLVETLIAILILVTGLVAVSNLFAVAMSSTSIANRATAATAQAVEQMEELKAAPYDDPAMDPGGSVEEDEEGYFRVVDIPGAGRINVRWQITSIDNQLRMVAVRAEATDVIGARRTRAELRAFRACTAVAKGCPAP